MRHFRVALLALALLASAFSGGVSRVEGTVRDASGAVVPHASILCVGETTGFRFASETGQDGRYMLTVPEGRYNLVVRRPGFRLAARLGVQAASDGVVRADFEIAPEGVSESVTILGAAETRSTRETRATRAKPQPDTAALLSPDELRGLPHNDDTVTGLLALVPGVLFTPASRGEPGQFSSFGARPNTNRFKVDGVDSNTAVAGAGWPSFLPGDRLPAMTALGTTQTLAVLDSIQDVTVESQDAASLDQDPGAHVLIHTKSGADHFHGSLSYAGRPPALGATDWFANRFALGPDAPGLNSEKGSFGGPLQRDRTFVFVAAERLSLRQGYAWTTTVPSLLARVYSANLEPLLNEFPLPNGPDLKSFGIAEYIGQSRTPAALTAANIRFDRQLSPEGRLFMRLGDTPSWSESGLTQTNLTHYRGRVATLGSTWTTGAWVHDSRLSFSRNEAESAWSASAGGQNPLPAFYSQYPSLAADFSNISVGGAGSVSLGQNGRNRQNQWQASHTSGLRLSRHEVQFGIGVVDLQPLRSGADTSVTVAFGTPTNVILGPPVPIWITNSRTEANSVRLFRLSTFARDSWKVNSRLSLTFGLGASWVAAPRLRPADNLFLVDGPAETFTAMPQNQPIWRGNPVRLTPTVAAAWSFGGAVVRASWAVFQDTGSAAATDQLNGIPYQQIRSPNGAPFDFNYNPTLLSTVQLGHGFARDFQLATYQRWNVRVEHSFHEAGSLQLGYTGMIGAHELRKEILLDPSSTLGGLTFVSSDGKSQYHALSAVYRRALARGLQANVSYVWSHSIDLGSADSAVFQIAPTLNAATDRGSSDFDARHVVDAALSYSVPSWRGHGLAARLTSNWTFGALVTARTGFPVDVLISETLDGFAIANFRAGLFPGVQPWIADPNLPGGRGLNPNAFGYPLRSLAPMGRNVLRGFGLWQADMSAERVIALPGAWRVALRAEAYNVFNHPEFGDPLRYASNPLFGQSPSPLNLMFGSGSPGSGESPALVTGAPRSLQVSLRLIF